MHHERVREGEESEVKERKGGGRKGVAITCFSMPQHWRRRGHRTAAILPSEASLCSA
jgi:hypothetical protein